MRNSGLGALAFALVATVACNNGSTTPVLAPATNIETFTGTVPFLDTHNGADFHNFAVAQTGTVSVTLTAAGPPATITEGLAVGTPSSSTCSVPPGNATLAVAGTIAQLSGTLNTGTYCVEVFDVGNQLVDITYSVTVAHP